jgi:mono/diheme cytochrome c family protein
MKTRLTLALLMTALALPALADEPGPGGSRPPVPKDGADLYRTYCQVCHMADAKGAVGAGMFPALANNQRIGTAQYAIYLIAKGKGGMPYFNESLTPAQIADVTNYIRTHFGNSYKDVVTAKDVEPFAKPPASGRR